MVQLYKVQELATVMEQPKRRMSDLGPSRAPERRLSSPAAPTRPSARPVPPALRHPAGQTKVQATPTAPMPGSVAARSAALRKQAEYQAKVAAAYQARRPVSATRPHSSSEMNSSSRTEPLSPATAPAVETMPLAEGNDYAQITTPLHPLAQTQAAPKRGLIRRHKETQIQPISEPAYELTAETAQPAFHNEPVGVIDDAFFDLDEPEGTTAPAEETSNGLGDVNHTTDYRYQDDFEPDYAGSFAPSGGPMMLTTPATDAELRLPKPQRRGLRIVAQLFLSLVIILGVAIAIVYVYVRYYQ